MTSRTIRLALGVTALALAAALPASAQSVETRGVVQRVDTSAGIVYFTDGRAKVELALARGRRRYDKRQAIAKRDADSCTTGGVHACQIMR